jgi:medium-chain acyl-[acyl-carrier-protein] hydrolase
MIVSGHRAPQLPDRHPAISNLPDTEIVAKLRTLGGTSDEVLRNPELMNLMLPLLRADFAACETYVYRDQEPLACSLTAFGGNDDRQVNREEICAWRFQTRGPFAMYMFPGGHFFFQSAQALVLRILGRDLRQILTRMSGTAQA